MTIVYCGEGDLFKSDCQTLTCPVNTVGVMGAGLALAFRNRVPGLFEFYQEACKEKRFKVGDLLVFPIPDTDKQVLLFPTKAYWRNPSKIEYVESGLKTLKEQYKELGIKSLAMVPIGCGRGQLDFIRCVKPLIYHHLKELEVDVSILISKTY
jgi:O-acetyl-ADP-ribose deacetylase (regulator of RNase III)